MSDTVTPDEQERYEQLVRSCLPPEATDEEVQWVARQAQQKIKDFLAEQFRQYAERHAPLRRLGPEGVTEEDFDAGLKEGQ